MIRESNLFPGTFFAGGANDRFAEIALNRTPPTAKTQDVSIEAWRAVAENKRGDRDAVLYAIAPDGTRLNSYTRPLEELARDYAP